MGVQAEKFKNSLVALVNKCELDIATAYYILKDVLNITEKEYYKQLALEVNKNEQAQVEENK